MINIESSIYNPLTINIDMDMIENKIIGYKNSSSMLGIGSSGLTKCSCNFCRKMFLRTSQHVYKRIGFGKTKYYCSYKCMKSWERRQMESERTLIRYSTYKGLNKKMTLQKWAEEGNVDYERFWALVRLNKMRIDDAIITLNCDEK